MGAAEFFADVLGDARAARRATGLPVSVILAQWANETGYGTSRAWREGHNYAGVSPGGRVAYYADRGAGLAGYVDTVNRPTYDSVRASLGGSAHDVAQAVADSPWAAGHYNGGRGLTTVMDRFTLTSYDLPGLDDLPGLPGLPGLGELGDALVGPFVDRLRDLVLLSLFLSGGIVLIVLGAWRSMPPGAKSALGGAAGAAAGGPAGASVGAQAGGKL